MSRPSVRRPMRVAAALLAAAACSPLLAVPPEPSSAPASGALRSGWMHPKELPFTNALAERLKAPPGYRVGVFANRLGHARMLLPVGDGAVLLSRPKSHDVVLLRDANRDGVADEARTVASGLARVHGLARDGDTVYLAGEHDVWRAALQADGSLGKPVKIASGLPDGGQHPYRTIGVRDGWLYVSVGSSCNDCVESNPEHATMLRMRPDGSDRAIFARGLRNTIGFGWHPATGALWGMEHGTDWRGDDLPPEELNRIVADGNYGWPYCWGKREIDDSRDDPPGTTKPKFCADSRPSVLEAPAHSAPIGMTFNDADGLGAEHRGDAFVAMRGSWNRTRPREPKIVRVDFDNGEPRDTQDFVTGFLTDAGWFGRLAGVAVASDGALLFTDDMNGVVYRVSRDAAGNAAAAPADPRALQRVAHLPGFDTPESVLHDAEQDVYFVSNIGGKPAAKDGNGFISRVTPDGRVENSKFIGGGLHAPKGMAIVGPLLWVSDIDRVLAFDRRTGKPVHAVAVPGSKFLNDVAAAPDGAVYVSDSGITFDADGAMRHAGPDRIVRIDADGNAKVVLENEVPKDGGLGGPNGLMWDAPRNRLLIAQMHGKHVLGWTPGRGAPAPVVAGVGRFDGLARAGNGELLVSSGVDSTIYAMRDDMLVPLVARPPAPADIAVDAKRDRLLVPSLQGDWVEIWQLPAR